MSDILERIKTEHLMWVNNPGQSVWEDKEVGKFINWYNENLVPLKAKPMYTSCLIRRSAKWKDPEKLDRLWARFMLERGDDDT